MTTQSSTERAELTVSYEGEALDEHTMDVRDLAPALLALGQAVDRANTLLNGDRAQVTLSIRATQQGSFEILLLLEQVLDQSTEMLSGDFITSAANIKTLLFGAGAASIPSVINVLKRLRGAEPARVEPSGDNVTLEFDNFRLTVPAEIARLALDRRLRETFEAVMQPLKREGIQRVRFRERDRTLESVEKEEAPAFDRPRPTTPADGDQTSEVVSQQYLKPDAVRFDGDGRWRFSDGSSSHSYRIEDEAFLREVERGERAFSRRDSLLCEVAVTQTLSPEGNLRTDYSIRHVIEHIQPAAQGQLLPLDAQDGD